MRLIKKGATSQTLYLVILDSASTTGGRKTGIAFNTASLVANYVRNGAARTAITLATQTASGAWSSGGFVEVDATNAPGLYRLDVPDAAFATGVDSVVVTLKGAAGMVGVEEEVQLTAVDLQDSVRAGMTALPNAAAGANGGLPLGDASARVDVGKWLGTAVTAATAGVPDTNAARINNVSASSVTTINANQGTTQPVNFTGTGAAALAKSDMVDVAGAAVSTASAQIGVNAVNLGGTAQTGRDIGASVLLSAGTGTGQLDFTAGVVKANLAQILGTALTETAGQIAAAFKQFFNIASPTSTANLITAVGSVTGSVASVTGAVGSVTGAVGSVTGSVGSVAAGGITASSIAADAIGASELAADAVAEIADAVWDEVLSGHLTATTTGAALNGATAPTAAVVADAVWDEVLSGHLTATTTGAALNGAGSAGDPWTTALPGAYGAGTAGNLVGNNLTGNAYTRLGAPVGASISADIAAVQADTDNVQTRLPAALVSGRMDSSVGAMAAGVVTAAAVATDAIDSDALATSAVTEIAAGVATGSAPTAADNAAAVWNAVAASFTAAGSMGQKLNAAGGAADPLLNPVPGAYVSGTAGYALGTLPGGVGSGRYVYTVHSGSDAGPLIGAGVSVWVTSDSAGTNIVAGSLITNDLSQVTFFLNPGTYYFWRQKAGWNFTNPDMEVVP